MRITAVAPLALVCLALAGCQSESTGPSASRPSLLDTRPSAFVATPCADCVFGPTTYTRTGGGGPETITATFAASAGGRYSVDIDDLGSAGADGSVELNGVTLLAKRQGQPTGSRHVVVEVTLQTSNTLIIRLTGKKGSQLQVSVRSLCDIGPLPNPVLALQEIRPDFVDALPRNFYELDVTNNASFPDAMFVQSPELPPCGSNTSASRTWVEIFVDGSRYYGFCALNSGAGLNLIYFVWDPALPPPTSAYIQVVDRKCGITYQSNEISLPAPQ